MNKPESRGGAEIAEERQSQSLPKIPSPRPPRLRVKQIP
jgi:hypothetical protein